MCVPAPRTRWTGSSICSAGVTQRLHEQAEDEDKKKGLHAFACNPLIQPLILVPLTGIELVTFALRMRCSTD